MENNVGIMVVKNKNVQSSEYNKKRKLTKVNKDLNLGHGKVWTNRMKKIVIPKVLPKLQFNCQDEINILLWLSCFIAVLIVIEQFSAAG